MKLANISPSNMARRMACPGSRREEAKYPQKKETTLDQIRGIVAHHVAAECLLHERTPGYYLDQQVTTLNFNEEVSGKFDREDSSAVMQYVNYVWQRKEDIASAVVSVEETVSVSPWLEAFPMQGIVDCALIGSEMMEIIDYKHGTGVIVDPEENAQLLLYAAGKAIHLDWNSISGSYPIQMTIVQPRGRGEEKIRSWTITAYDLYQRMPAFIEAIKATEAEDAALIPGDSQCRFCLAKAECPARNKRVENVFQAIGGSTDAQPAVSAQGFDALLRQDPEGMSLDTISLVLAEREFLQGWLRAVTERAYELDAEGTKIPGWKRVATSANRKWSLEDEPLIKRLSSLKDQIEEKNLGKAAVTTTKPISPAQAEKIIKPRVSARTWSNVTKLIIRPEGKPALVPDSDERPAIGAHTDVFQPIDTENPFG